MRYARLLLCLVATVASAQDANQLVGRWRSAETSKGGIGAMYDFLANGTVQFSPGAIVLEPFRVEGGKLTVGAGSDAASCTLQFDGDNRVRMTLMGQTEVFTRLGTRTNAANPLIGEWTTNREMDGAQVVVHWIFGPDSNSLFTIRFTTQTGTYTLQNGRLTARFDGKVGLDGPVAFSNGAVEIQRSGGRVLKLVRY